MTKRGLKIDEALKALPDAEDLGPLREALLGGSVVDAGLWWTHAEAFATLDTRLADPDALSEQVPVLADRVRARVEEVMRHTVAALRALQAGEHAQAARRLVAAGEAEERDGRVQEAERCYTRALELGRKPRDRQAEGLALRRLGRVARARGDRERAARLYREGFDVAIAQRDEAGAVVACQGLGNVYVDQGRWDDARAWYMRGIELCPADPPSADYVHLCNGLSAVERRRGHLQAAAEWLSRGEAAAAATVDLRVLGYVENGWGMLELARGRYPEAEAAFRRALNLPLDPAARVGVMVNLADPLLRTGRLLDAEAVARQAEAQALLHGVAIKLPDVYRTLGAVAGARGERDGFVFYEQALEICREHGLPRFEAAVTQQHYARFEAALGECESAAARLAEAERIFAELGARVQVDEARDERERLAPAAEEIPG